MILWSNEDVVQKSLSLGSARVQKSLQELAKTEELGHIEVALMGHGQGRGYPQVPWGQRQCSAKLLGRLSSAATSRAAASNNSLPPLQSPLQALDVHLLA